MTHAGRRAGQEWRDPLLGHTARSWILQGFLFAVIVFSGAYLIEGIDERMEWKEVDHVLLAYYDPSVEEPMRWKPRNLLVKVGFLMAEERGFWIFKQRRQLHGSLVDGAMSQISSSPLFRWPIQLSDGTKVYHLSQLDQVRES